MAYRDKTHAEFMARLRKFLEEMDRKYGGPPPPLTEDELDDSETEIHNFLRRGPPTMGKVTWLGWSKPGDPSMRSRTARLRAAIRNIWTDRRPSMAGRRGHSCPKSWIGRRPKSTRCCAAGRRSSIPRPDQHRKTTGPSGMRLSDLGAMLRVFRSSDRARFRG